MTRNTFNVSFDKFKIRVVRVTSLLCSVTQTCMKNSLVGEAGRWVILKKKNVGKASTVRNGNNCDERGEITLVDGKAFSTLILYCSWI